MKYSVLSLLFLASACMAGETGIVYQGKTYVLFKDGKKVGDLPAEISRKPASIHGSGGITIRYSMDSDHGVICYNNDDAPDRESNISCVKL